MKKINVQILLLIVIFIISAIIYFLSKTKTTNPPNDWITLHGKYIEMKLPNNWVELSPNDSSVIWEASKSAFDSSEYTILGTSDLKQTIILNAILEGNINTSEDNGNLYQATIRWLSRIYYSNTLGKTDNISQKEVKIGNTFFQKITIPNNNKTEYYIIKLKDNTGAIVFYNDNSDIFLDILKTVNVIY